MLRGRLKLILALSLSIAFSCSGLVGYAEFAWGAEDKFPSKPVRIIAPNKPGIATDVAGRSIQPFLAKYLGNPVVVENMEGGAYMVGRGYVYKAEPDGYTLLVSALPSLALAELMSNDTKYKSKEMTPVFNLTGGDPQGIWLPANSPIKNMADLKAASQKKELKCSFAGIGSNGQLVAALMKQDGFKIKEISYENALLALMSQEVDFAITRLFAVPKDEKSVSCIAITTPKRLSEFPSIPTALEQGVGIDLTMRNGIFGPPKIPADRVKILAAGFGKAVADPAYQEMVKKQGLEVEPIPPSELGGYVEKSYDLVLKALPILKAGSK
jgi:tripartite-type tricarboxylate transporter receptor subunit TctC